MNTKPNLTDPDAFYAALVAAHEGLTADRSADYNARLLLLLANQIGDNAVLVECIEAAKSTNQD